MKTQSWLRIYIIASILLNTNILTFGQLEDSEKIANLINSSNSMLKLNQYKFSRDCAEQILKIDEDNCAAYIQLGNIYAQYAKKHTFKSKFERSVIYCLAIDMYEIAKQTNNECTEEAKEKIQIYSNYLIENDAPNIKTKEGEEITINDWINRKTKFRYAK